MKLLLSLSLALTCSALPLFAASAPSVDSDDETDAAAVPPSVPAAPAAKFPEEAKPSSVKADPVLPPSAPTAPAPAATDAPKTEQAVPSKRTPASALDQKGHISKLDATARTLTVEGKDFVLSPHAKVFVDGAQRSLADLKEQDLVAVVYFAKPDGSNMATRVIKGRPHRKKKAKTGG